MILEQTLGSTRIITLNAPTRHNPFSHELEMAIRYALQRADNDDSVQAVIVYGGKERSFSAGGDFNEVRLLNSAPDIEKWIDRVIDLYISVLSVNKPTIAAIDGYAIGMGFQFSLMFDQRIMSDTAEYIMPELKHGIGCSVGAAIINFTHSYSTMQEIIYQCNNLNAEDCLRYRLVNKVVNQESVLQDAIQLAEILSKYPQIAFSNTKKSANKSFIQLLESTRSTSKKVHTAAFQALDAQKHFTAILNRPE